LLRSNPYIILPQKTNSFVLSGSEDKTVKKWFLPFLLSDKKHKKKETEGEGEKKKPASLFTIRAHDKDINAIAVAPNDGTFATGSQDKTAKIWSCENGGLLGTLKGHKRGVWSLEFSPVDKCIATSSGN
jgi:U3 small nucleolar RNA-associated protein 13